jgi:hypothetical protein
MAQPKLTKLDIWKKHEESVLEILVRALLRLRNHPNLEEQEDLISRSLYYYIQEAQAELEDSGVVLNFNFVYHAHNQPLSSDTTPTNRENKIPDFICGMRNHLELNPFMRSRNFVIECKRLGNPTPSVTNKKYVSEGILRFCTEEHGYGKGEKTSAMLGYVQRMGFEEILREVNNYVTIETLLPINLIGTWQEKGVSQLTQVIERVINPSTFTLLHIWVDLRDCYP